MRPQQRAVKGRHGKRRRSGVMTSCVTRRRLLMCRDEHQVTNRLRFNRVSPESEVSMAQQLYAQILAEYGQRILPAWHPDSRLVQKVLDRLIPASGLQDQEWKVHVIDDDSQKNAFVIPGWVGVRNVFTCALPCGAFPDHSHSNKWIMDTQAELTKRRELAAKSSSSAVRPHFPFVQLPPQPRFSRSIH